MTVLAHLGVHLIPSATVLNNVFLRYREGRHLYKYANVQMQRDGHWRAEMPATFCTVNPCHVRGEASLRSSSNTLEGSAGYGSKRPGLIRCDQA